MNPSHKKSSSDGSKTATADQHLDGLVQACQRAFFAGNSIATVLSAAQQEELRRRYSHFEDRYDSEGFLIGGAHVVDTIFTPRPYIHFMSTNHSREFGLYGSLWDPSGAGFSCLDSVISGAITSHKDNSYVPTAPRATDQRNFFLREVLPGNRAEIWHLLPQRGRDSDSYEIFRCEQGLGTVRISSRRNALAGDLLVFVPVDDPLEVWRLRLVNETDRKRRFSLFVAVNWGLESYPGHYFDPRVVCYGRHYSELNALLAFNNDKKNTHPRTGFLTSREPLAGFDMSAEDFSGGGNFRIFPQAVEEGHCRGSLGVQPYLGIIAALQIDLVLEAAAEKTLDFLLGAVDSRPEKAREQVAAGREKYFSGNGLERELERLENSWNRMIGCQMAKSPDVELDRFYNVWSKYQVRNQSRLPLGLSMIGYRDTLQYMLGILSFNPEFAAAHLPTVLRHQYPDGRAMRQFSKFENAPHDQRMYMDNCSWISDTLVEYVKETGDFAFLEREEGFFDSATGQVDDRNKASLYEHARRSLQVLFETRGLHGLCRIGHGDWNDSLDGVGKDGAGVSVWLSMALVHAARKFRELALQRRDGDSLELVEKIIREMTPAINGAAWDGAHYVYAFMPDGTPVGSSVNAEGKIHLNVNAWSLFNGVAQAAGRVEQVLRAVSRLDTPLGHLLLDPPYTEKMREVGRIADIVPGLFENGSIYTHGQSFLAYGLVSLGRAEEAWRCLKQCLPGSTLPDISSGPLHQTANFTAGPAHEHFGRNLYSNFTGSMAWLRRTLSHLYGVLADFEALVIDPCIPAFWDSYEAVKVFRGCRVRVRVHNPRGVSRGVASAVMDGRSLPVEGGRVSLPVESLRDRRSTGIDVELGG